MTAVVDPLWQRLTAALTARGALAGPAATARETARHADAKLGTDFVGQFVEDYYLPRRYGGTPSLTDADAEALVAAVEALPVAAARTEATKTAPASQEAMAVGLEDLRAEKEARARAAAEERKQLAEEEASKEMEKRRAAEAARDRAAAEAAKAKARQKVQRSLDAAERVRKENEIDTKPTGVARALIWLVYLNIGYVFVSIALIYCLSLPACGELPRSFGDTTLLTDRLKISASCRMILEHQNATLIFITLGVAFFVWFITAGLWRFLLRMMSGMGRLVIRRGLPWQMINLKSLIGASLFAAATDALIIGLLQTHMLPDYVYADIEKYTALAPWRVLL